VERSTLYVIATMASLQTLALAATQRYYRIPKIVDTQHEVMEWLETHGYNLTLEGRLTGELHFFNLKLACNPVVFTDDQSHSLLLRWDSPLVPAFWLEAHLNLEKIQLSVVRGRGVPHDSVITYCSPPALSIVCIRWDSVSCPEFWLQISVY